MMTVSEVAKFSGKSEYTVRRHLRSGRLAGTRPGDGNWTATREAVESWLAGSDARILVVRWLSLVRDDVPEPVLRQLLSDSFRLPDPDLQALLAAREARRGR